MSLTFFLKLKCLTIFIYINFFPVFAESAFKKLSKTNFNSDENAVELE